MFTVLQRQKNKLKKKNLKKYHLPPEIPIVSNNTNTTVTIETPEIDIPEIDIEVVELEVDDFEMEIDDFGELTLDGLDSDLSSMFAQTKAPKSVIFVIDYSISMKGKKFELAKKELTTAIKRLKNGTKYQLIFFSDPFWLAEDKLTLIKNWAEERTSIKGDIYKRHKHDQWMDTQGNVVPIDIQYRVANDITLNESLAHIQKNPLSLGTRWIKPLRLALTLNPQVIYFMTDGSGGSLKQAEEIAREAENANTIIHTIAFMIPEKVENIMLSMANLSGGLFTSVNKNGEHEIKNLKK